MKRLHRPVTAPVLVAVMVSVCPLAASAQDTPATSAQREQGLLWRNRPTIRFGEVRIDLRLKLQFDWRGFDPVLDDDDATTFDFRQRRVGLQGEVTNHLEYEIEREVANEIDEPRPWKDVFVNWRTFRQAEVRAGRFKIPFGLEQLTSPSDIDFAYRSLISSSIAPARDEGVMVHGRYLRRGFTYAVGVFDDDGDNGRLREPQFVASGGVPPEIGTTVAARVTATPLRPLMLPPALQDLRVGAAYTWADVPEGLNSLRGRNMLETFTFFEPVFVNGPRRRFGFEVDLTSGPASVRSEWMQSRETRDGQGLRNEDLSDFVSTGWYLSGTWVLTGEAKADGVTPRRPLFRDGFGALEVGVRYDQLELGSASQEGPAFPNPRADHLLPNRDAVWTVGVNWFPIRWIRISANAFHETFDDPDRTPIPGITDYWSGLLRLQIVF
jgi:phosphate-selective porin